MALDPETAAVIAKSFLNTDLPLKALGWGMNGFVYLSPDGRTAVKVHRYNDHFEQELEVYRYLRKLRINELLGISIPKLRRFSLTLRLIEMDFVTPPFLLDFAGARFAPPDFTTDAMEHWHADLAERYGPNVGIVYQIHDWLAKRGVYYTDFHRSNLNLEGLPGLEPFGSQEHE